MKKSTLKKIDIGFSCQEDFNKMKPTSSGSISSDRERYCGSCERIVIDFSKFSTHEILAYFENYSSKTCGRFSKNQLKELNKQLSITQPSKTKKLVSSVVATTLLSTSGVMAQNAVTLDAPIFMEVTKKDGLTVESTVLLKGTIVDHFDKAPLSGAKVSIPNLSLEAMTDSEGNFEIEIEQHYDMNTRIQVSNQGYDTQELSIVQFSNQDGKIVLFNSNESHDINIMQDSIFVLKGKIVSEDTDEPLIGAGVHIRDTRIGAITDIDGNFEIVLEEPIDVNSKINIYYIGFDSKDLTITELNNQGGIVKLREGIMSTGEVVIIEHKSKAKKLWDRVKRVFKK